MRNLSILFIEQLIVASFLILIMFCSNNVFYTIEVPCTDVIINDNQHTSFCIISNISEKEIKKGFLKEALMVINTDTIQVNIINISSNYKLNTLKFQCKSHSKLRIKRVKNGFILIKRSLLSYIAENFNI